MQHTYVIVVGVDGSAPGQRALNWAVAEAGRRSRTDQLVAVQAVTTWHFEPLAEPMGAFGRLPDPRRAAEWVLAHAIAEARADHPGVAVAGEVIEGNPDEALVRASTDADLLVLGSHGHGQIFHAVLGSVAEACVRNATCPVVVIPVARTASTSRTELTPAATVG